MAGELPADQPPHELLGAAVGRGDRGPVGLELHLDARTAEVGADEIAARPGELDHECAVRIEVHAILETANGPKDTKIELGAGRNPGNMRRCAGWSTRSSSSTLRAAWPRASSKSTKKTGCSIQRI